MLGIHLDQSTHMASRSREVIAAHVAWLRDRMREAFGGDARPEVLDVACGPGLYCHELARRGHPATGLDFAPAAIAWAREEAARQELACAFVEADLTRLDAAQLAALGPVDVVTFWFGEFHSFPPEVARRLLGQLAGLLRPGGLFVLEYQPSELYPREDLQEWRACASSPLSDRPHLWLQEYHWDERLRAEINVHWVIDAETGTLARYAQSGRAWRGVSVRFVFAVLVARRP